MAYVRTITFKTAKGANVEVTFTDRKRVEIAVNGKNYYACNRTTDPVVGDCLVFTAKIGVQGVVPMPEEIAPQYDVLYAEVTEYLAARTAFDADYDRFAARVAAH